MTLKYKLKRKKTNGQLNVEAFYYFYTLNAVEVSSHFPKIHGSISHIVRPQNLRTVKKSNYLGFEWHTLVIKTNE